MDGPLQAMAASLKASMPDLLAAVRDEAGAKSAALLRSKLRAAGRFRVAADAEPVGFAFDVTNPKAVQWIEDHALELVTGITDDTREEIRALLDAAFVEGVDVDELSSQIADALGDDARAEVIARTETMDASNEGQQEAWSQAVDDGLLTGNEKQEWITTPDDRLCPICDGLDGQQTELDGSWDADGEDVDGPPAHPNCRCTVGLVV